MRAGVPLVTPALETLREIALRLDQARDEELRLEIRLGATRDEIMRLTRLYGLAVDDVGIRRPREIINRGTVE